MSNFIDIKNQNWDVEIVTKSVELVKKYCKDKNGKPIDLFRIIELNQIEQILYDVELLCNIVFVLCRDQVYERFDVDEYDKQNADLYEDFPEWKNETKMIKASRWFGSFINGAVMEGMIVAIQEALINFFPTESQRNTFKKALAKIQEMEKLHSEMIMEQMDKNIEQLKPKMKQMIEDNFRVDTFEKSYSNTQE